MIDLAIDGDYDRGLPERRMRVRRRDAVTAGTNPDPAEKRGPIQRHDSRR